ncbi:MAG: hypothetical protein ACREQQ_02945 [Candidatus Binatia bacterium]
MRRRAVVAFLAAVVFFAVTLVHSAFACTMAAHGEPARHAGHQSGDHGCNDTRTPPCCQQPATAVAVHKMSRPADDVRAVASSVLAGPVLANLAGDVTAANRCRAVTAPPASGSSLRTHLLLRTLLL